MDPADVEHNDSKRVVMGESGSADSQQYATVMRGSPPACAVALNILGLFERCSPFALCPFGQIRMDFYSLNSP